MQLSKPNQQPQTPSIPRETSKPNPQNPFLTIQNHCSGFLTNLSNSLSNPTASSLRTRLESSLETLSNQAKQALQMGASRFTSPSESTSSSSKKTPLLARVSPLGSAWSDPAHRFDLALSTQAIEERLAGVPVYALSNSEEEFVLVSGARSGKSLGLFCFKEEDAEAILNQMKSMNQDMRQGSKVVAVALNKVFQLKVDGVAFRFIPDSHQVVNAIKEKEKAGDSTEDFSGVPIFQSRSLVLKSQNKRYRPVFFRKEDLEDSLRRASSQQGYLNPSLRKGDIQVCILEEIIKAMKGSSASKWDDVVFIPPGFNVSTDLSRESPIAKA